MFLLSVAHRPRFQHLRWLPPCIRHFRILNIDLWDLTRRQFSCLVLTLKNHTSLVYGIMPSGAPKIKLLLCCKCYLLLSSCTSHVHLHLSSSTFQIANSSFFFLHLPGQPIMLPPHHSFQLFHFFQMLMLRCYKLWMFWHHFSPHSHRKTSPAGSTTVWASLFRWTHMVKFSLVESMLQVTHFPLSTSFWNFPVILSTEHLTFSIIYFYLRASLMAHTFRSNHHLKNMTFWKSQVPIVYLSGYFFLMITLWLRTGAIR